MAEQKPPIPVEAVRETFREFLRGEGVDPDTVDFKVSHADYIGTFGGETKTIKITVLDRRRLEAQVCECYAVVKREAERLLPWSI